MKKKCGQFTSFNWQSVHIVDIYIFFLSLERKIDYSIGNVQSLYKKKRIAIHPLHVHMAKYSIDFVHTQKNTTSVLLLLRYSKS